jgi:hypothetical protein
MHDALGVHANVGVLEAGDRLAAAETVGKHREHVAGELLELRVVGAARESHQPYSSPIGRPPACSARPSTATASASSAYGKQKVRANEG